MEHLKKHIILQTKINQYNNKGKKHGYWEVFWSINILFKGTYINGYPHGVCEIHRKNHNLIYKGSYDTGKYIGLWKTYHSDGTLKETHFYAN
jgi:antitoxin component YwqK of YwqJK toxin-antitoxin module